MSTAASTTATRHNASARSFGRIITNAPPTLIMSHGTSTANPERDKAKDDLRLVIDTIPGLVWSALPDGYIDFLNQRWLDYTGLKPEEARGWGWQAAIHPDDLPGLVDYWKSILKAGTAGEYEARLRQHDGAYRWFLFRGVPLHDEDGILVKWYGTNTDIEARRASEHLARGQVDALTHVLASLAKESEPEKFLEHVLQMVGRQLRAHSLGVWEMNETSGRVQLVANFENGRLQLATPEEIHASRQVGLTTQEHPIWTEFFQTGAHCVIGDIGSDTVRVRIAEVPNSPWYDWFADTVVNPTSQTLVQRLHALGIVATLAVPMFVRCKVTGLISIRFKQHRDYRPEEIELIRALSHQTMLAIQLIRLSDQSRRSAVVAERNRMAREIHDTLAQGFTGVIVQLEAAADATSKGLAKEAEEHLTRAGDLARESLKEARRSVLALRPQALEENNLCEALEGLIQKMTARTTMRAEFDVKGRPQSLPAEWEENILRIGQEILTNALRHAHASEFNAALTFDQREIRLSLCDNGTGFDPTRRHDGFGLLGIRERVEAMGGQMNVESAAGQGTMILIVLPLESIARSSQP